jgi:hypothetical protein
MITSCKEGGAFREKEGVLRALSNRAAVALGLFGVALSPSPHLVPPPVQVQDRSRAGGKKPRHELLEMYEEGRGGAPARIV